MKRTCSKSTRKSFVLIVMQKDIEKKNKLSKFGLRI